MKVWLSSLLLTAFAMLGTGQTAKQIEVPLTFKKFQNVYEMMAFSLGGVTEFLDAHPPKGYASLPGAVKPSFFQLRLEDVTLTGVVAYSSAKVKSYDRLWVDWNGDKKFTGDEKLMGTETVKDDERFVVFGPIERTLNGRKLEAYFLVHNNSHIHLVPAGYYEGEVSLNGRKFKLGIADGNLNGVLGDRITGSMWEDKGDTLLVDFDGNAAFGIQRLTEAAFLFGEIHFLTPLAQLPNGNFYRIKVSEDGSRLLLELDNSPLGKVRMACKKFTLLIRGQEGMLMVRGEGGECSLPTGSYQTYSVTMAEEDNQSKLWYALLYFYPQQPRFRVASDKPTDLPFGPPLKLVLDIEREGKAFDFSLSLEDKSGNSLNAVFTPEMKPPQEPTLVISDMKGKIVKTMKFHYG